MRSPRAALATIVLCLIAQTMVLAQGAPTPAAVPRVITITGVFQPVDGQPPRAAETITLALYTDPAGGAPLWQETQSIALDSRGRYALLLGATSAEGIPAAVLDAGAQWLGTTFDRPGEVEGQRVQLTSVPYTLRAADADTLGGRPASAYLLAPSAATGEHSATATAATATASGVDATPEASADAVLPGTDNFLAKYLNAGADVGTSAVFESAGRVGIGTTAPLDALHVNFTNTNGAVTGLAVQNLGNTTASYSGMLFYDQNGLLGQFQGFNNGTHEYRINNIARVSPGGAFNGSINFMIGSASRFFVSSSPNGSVGIGTTAPSPTANLDVSNAVSGSGTTNVNITTYSANGFGPNLIGKKARGTQGLPTAVLNNDGLLDLSANGYGATGFAGVNSAIISMRASENWTDTAQGSYMNFATTANGTTVPVNRMTIASNGSIGIGTFSAQASLEVSNANGASAVTGIMATTFANAGNPLFIGRRARGTGLAPTAVLSGDIVAGFVGQGYTGTGFTPTRGGMFVRAAENWTTTAQGTRLDFNIATTGTTGGGTAMTLDPFGKLGLGTTAPAAAVEVVRDPAGGLGGPLELFLTRYADTSSSGEPNVVLRTARGTKAAPTAVQEGDELGGFAATGYGATGFGEGNAGMAGIAAENWTDTAQGAALAFFTTPLGTNGINAAHMAIMPDGNVGIGTLTDITTIADKLQVFGDIRVGTTGTNGCVKNFNGDPLTGTCASDRRFKKDITPFGPVLDQLTALQPVHYSWRAADFPAQHFGTGRAYGLIAQDVEQTLPELVVTNDAGFKAVDYSKLPLLTIQAVKELKSENDALRRRVAELEQSDGAALRQRVAELERLVNQLLGAASTH